MDHGLRHRKALEDDKQSRKRNIMEKRLEELRAELVKGQRQLEALDYRRREVRDTVLRISGAIQVLEELQAADRPPAPEETLAAASA